MQIPDDAGSIEIEVAFENGSKTFKLDTTIERRSPLVCEALIRVSPEPAEDDFIVYTIRFKSKYLNQIYAGDIRNQSILTVRDRKFDCFDGSISIQPTKRLKAQYRFPREYGLSKNDVQLVVGSYTTTIDHVVESEINRAKLMADSFGGDLCFELEVESPWLRHMYGFAWNLPLNKVGS